MMSSDNVQSIAL